MHQLVERLEQAGLLVDELAVTPARWAEALGGLDAISDLALGQNLRRYRKDRGLSQEAFADVLGVHRTYVGGLERGERNVSLRALECYAEQLGVAALSLLDGSSAQHCDSHRPIAARCTTIHRLRAELHHNLCVRQTRPDKASERDYTQTFVEHTFVACGTIT